MSDVKSFIESGILEMYVLGNATPEETARVEQMCARHEDVRREIEEISIALEQYAGAHAVEPDPTLKPFIMAMLDYTDRLKNGEQPSEPPMIHMGSRIDDYAQWLNRADLQLEEPFEDAQARIIGYTPEVTTAIVWLKYGSPPEVHTDELEKFLIVEGTCIITIGDQKHEMGPGDALIIPLHVSHKVKVTSDIPCKVILQRIAA